MQGPDVCRTMWENDDPRALFMKRLIRQRAVEFMRSPKYMRLLRHRNDLAVRDQRMFGHIWAEYGTNVYQLIAEAHGETWDAETEEKERYRAEHDASESEPEKIEAPVNQKKRGHDDLVAAREGGARERQHQLQGEPEKSIRLLEEDEGRGKRACCEEEGPAAKKEGRARSGSFYRRAGSREPSES